MVVSVNQSVDSYRTHQPRRQNKCQGLTLEHAASNSSRAPIGPLETARHSRSLILSLASTSQEYILGFAEFWHHGFRDFECTLTSTDLLEHCGRSHPFLLLSIVSATGRSSEPCDKVKDVLLDSDYVQWGLHVVVKGDIRSRMVKRHDVSSRTRGRIWMKGGLWERMG